MGVFILFRIFCLFQELAKFEAMEEISILEGYWQESILQARVRSGYTQQLRKNSCQLIDVEMAVLIKPLLHPI